MSTSPYQTLAREFLDLWQKQMASVVGDKEFIAAMLDMVQNLNTHNAHGTKAKSAAANASDSADADDGNVARLAFRLAMCEQRLAALEAGAKKPAGKPAAGKRPARRGKKPR
jgi:hypothetical protein